MKICKKCDQAAAIYLARYGVNLCKEHLIEFVRGRVKKIIKKYKLIYPYERIAVALSGGKDSAVLLDILDSIYVDALDLVGLHIDLGIAELDYSEKSLQLAKNICTKLGREFIIIDLKKEYQISMDLVKDRESELRRPLCGICGIFKRYLLNRYSLELNCEKLATGHLLDDEVSVLLMNIFNGNIEQLIRMGPHLIAQNPTMITRIKPLYEISEIETTIYAQLKNLETQDAECPYSRGAVSLKYKKILQNFEIQIPGIGNFFLQNFLNKRVIPLKRYYQNPNDYIKSCIECNGPTSEKICAFCNINKIIKENK